MGHTGNFIQKPIDLRGDLAYFFGINSGDLGYIISNAFINKWAKYKPVRFYSFGEISDNNRIDASHGFLVTDNFVGGQNRKGFLQYGLYDLVASAIENNGDWIYLPPNGTANYAPFRMLDFDGYKSTQYLDSQNRAIATCPTEPEANSRISKNYMPSGYIHSYAEIDPFEAASVELAGSTNYYVYMVYWQGNGTRYIATARNNQGPILLTYNNWRSSTGGAALFAPVFRNDGEYNTLIAVSDYPLDLSEYSDNVPFDAEGGDEGYDWFYMPGTLKTLTVVSNEVVAEIYSDGTPGYDYNNSIVLTDPEYSGDSFGASLKFKLKNDLISGGATNVVLHILLYDDSEGGSGYEQTFSIGTISEGGEYVTGLLSASCPDSYGGWYGVRAWLTYNVGSTAKTTNIKITEQTENSFSKFDRIRYEYELS